MSLFFLRFKVGNSAINARPKTAGSSQQGDHGALLSAARQVLYEGKAKI
jgi:hypothetical protein